MVEELNTSNDAYNEGKYSKTKDFFIGVGIALGGLVLFNLILALVQMILEPLMTPFWGFIVSMIILIFFIGGIGILVKRFYERRFVKIGVWVTLLLPVFIFLVLFGACALFFGFGY